LRNERVYSRLNKNELRFLDEFSKKLGISRSESIRVLVCFLISYGELSKDAIEKLTNGGQIADKERTDGRPRLKSNND